MRIIEPKVYVLAKENPIDQLKWLERLARVPYKSEGNITEDSFDPFLKKIINSGHTAMIEFEKMTFIIQCDRGVTHELVRHRVASFAQESTRYCNYSKDKQGGQVAFIRPFFFEEGTRSYELWRSSVEQAECSYMALLEAGASPQQARSVLPNSTKATIVLQMNFREMLLFFGLRCDPHAHPQMRQISIPMYRYCLAKYPTIFEGLNFGQMDSGKEATSLVSNFATVIPVYNPSDLPEDI